MNNAKEKAQDRKEEILKAEKFFNSQRHNCSDVELSRGAVYYPVSFITEILETYKREGVIAELESLKDDLCWYYNSYDDSATDVIDHRISELKK